MKIAASQSAMDYIRFHLRETSQEIGTFMGVNVSANRTLPDDWMIVEEKVGRDTRLRYFKLSDGALVEMVPPADFNPGN